MYRSFSIKNFRCFDELTLEGLGRINLIAGQNNVGKTALLEALWVHSGAVRPERVLQLDTQRGLRRVDPESTIDNLFFDFNHNSVIELSAKGDRSHSPSQLEISARENSIMQLPLEVASDDQSDSEAFTSQNQILMKYSNEFGEKTTSSGWLVERADNPRFWTVETEREQMPGPGPTRGVFLRTRRPSNSVDARRYSRLEISGQQGTVLQILQEIEPRLRRLAVVSTGELPAIYADIGLARLVPAQLLGEGMSRILNLALAISVVPNGIVLVDEFENGLHYTVMEKVWRAVAAFARSYDVQLFATTHSRECVYYAHRAFEKEEEEELRLFRIDRSKGKLRAVMYDRERLAISFEDGLGIR